MASKRLSNITILNTSFAITAFLGLAPFFVWHRNGIFYYGFILITFSIFTIFLITNTLALRIKDINLLLFTVFIILYMNYTDLESTVKALVLNISLFSYILMSTESKRKIFIYFSNIFAYALIPGILIYIIHQFRLDIGWSYLLPPNPVKAMEGWYYRNYYGAVVLSHITTPYIQGLYRLCGMFDEPGVLGTISALLLIGDGFKLRKNFKNILLLIGGILSFSLAFYILILAYQSMLALLGKKYKSILIIMIVFVIFGIFSTGVIQSDFIDNRIVNRIKIVDGRLQGDNRTTYSFESEFDDFLRSGTKEVLLGLGEGKSQANSHMAGTSSWKNVVYNNGFIGLVLLVLFFVITMFMFNRTIYGVMLLLIMLASIYQRPSVINLSYISIYIGGLINLKQNYAVEFYNKKS